MVRPASTSVRAGHAVGCLGDLAEDGPSGLGGAEQGRRLGRDDDLRVRAVGELRERVELEDRHQRRRRVGRRDRVVDRLDRLGPALGLEDRGLPVALGAEDRRLPLTLGVLDRRLPVAVGDVDRRLLEPSDWRILARFSWSACFWRASAWRIWGGGVISTISIRLIRIPHLSVTASICCWTSTLIRSRSDSAWSSDSVPMTERRAVRASASMATSKLAMLNSACLASTTWVKIVALTATTTLSLVMTSWRSPGRGISRMSTNTIASMNGDDHQPRLVDPAELAEPLDDADRALLDEVDRRSEQIDGEQHEQQNDDDRDDRRNDRRIHEGPPSVCRLSRRGGRRASCRGLR